MPRIGDTLLVAVALAATSLLPVAPAHGQYFGRNKVLWESFDFAILDTEHFSIYHYPPGSPAVDDVARLSERWYARLSNAIGHEFEVRNPLIIYADHSDFQQTLTTSGLIGEGTGGFTESLQNRVVLPLTGVNADNDHVLGHELVHAFQFDRLGHIDRAQGESAPQLPLWMTEGMAEYLSLGRHDTHTAMWLRDAVLFDMLPDPERMTRLELSPYRYGQAVWAYLGGRFGDRVALQLFDVASRIGLAGAVRQELGLEPEALLADFHVALRSAYDPVLAARVEARELARPLEHQSAGTARLNTGPSLSPDGTKVAFMSSVEIFTIDLYLADVATGEILAKLVSEEADSHYDYLSFIDSSVAWSPDSRYLAFTAFARGDRQIMLYDVERRRVDRELPLADLKGVSDPAWSPDGRYLAFSAIADGVSNLYRVEIATNRVTRLTADAYTAIQPAVAPDGRNIVFVTDRGPQTDLAALRFGPLQLARLDLATLAIEHLPIFPQGKHIDPHFSPDGGSVLFIGEPDGVADVFRYDLGTGGVERLTALKTGVAGITAASPALTVAAATGTIVFSVLEDGRFNLYAMDPDAQPALQDPPAFEAAGVLPPADDALLGLVTDYLQDPADAPSSYVDAPRRLYRPRLDLAYVGPATVGVSVDSYGTGVTGSLSAYFTDPLGTRQIGATMYGGTSEGYLDYEDTLGGEAAFINQERRFQWGAVASRLPYMSGGTFISEETLPGGEQAEVFNNVIEAITASELTAFAQYPFTLNRRVEISAGVAHIGYEATIERLVVPSSSPSYWETFDLETLPGLDLRRASLAYVVDTSYFGYVSPLRGRRLRLESEWSRGDLEYRTGVLDFRQYLFLNPLTLAFRVTHVARHGGDAESIRLAPLDVGRDTLVRGYDLASFDVAECTFTPASTGCPEYDRLFGSRIVTLNFEVRVPLVGSKDFGFIEGPGFPTEMAFFVDIGAASTNDDSVRWAFERDTTERVPVVSAGVAARMVIGGMLPVQLYYAAPFQRPQGDATFGIMISTGW